MIAKFFINKDKLSYFLIPIVAFFLIVPQYFNSLPLSEITYKNSFLFSNIFECLNDSTLLILNLIFNISNAYLLSFLCTKHELTENQNELPTLFYLIISASLGFTATFHPVIPATTILLFSINKLFVIYREENSLTTIFDASFLLSLSFLIYSPFMVFILLPIITLLIMKPFKINEWIASITGLFMPFFILTMFLYVLNRDFIEIFKVFSNTILKINPFIFNPSLIIFHIILIILILYSIYFLYSRINMFKVKSQKSIHVFLWMIAFGTIGIFLINEFNLLFFTLFIIPTSVFLANYIGRIRRKWIREFLTVSLLIGLICSNLQFLGIL
jgi:hypothetical protein